MFVNFKGTTYLVDFSRSETVQIKHHKHGDVEVIRRMVKRHTHCVVARVDHIERDGEHIVRVDRTILGEGKTTCSPKDTFDRRIGRRIALWRALTQAGFARPDSAGFFAALTAENNIGL